MHFCLLPSSNTATSVALPNIFKVLNSQKNMALLPHRSNNSAANRRAYIQECAERYSLCILNF